MHECLAAALGVEAQMRVMHDFSPRRRIRMLTFGQLPPYGWWSVASFPATRLHRSSTCTSGATYFQQPAAFRSADDTCHSGVALGEVTAAPLQRDRLGHSRSEQGVRKRELKQAVRAYGTLDSAKT